MLLAVASALFLDFVAEVGAWIWPSLICWTAVEELAVEEEEEA